MQLNSTTLEQLLEELPLPVVAKDRDGVIRILNRRARELYAPFGITTGARLPEILDQLGQQELKVEIERADSEVLRSGFSSVVFRMRPWPDLPDGPQNETQWRNSRFLVHDPEWGDLIVALAEDVTASARVEQALRDSEELFRLVWEQSCDAMRLIDEHGLILAVNDAFCRMTGRDRGDLEGQPMWNIYDAIPDAQRAAFLDGLFATGNRPFEDHFYERPDGRVVWCEVSYAPLTSATRGRLMLSIFRDITERKRYEAELLAAKDAAERATAAKNRFLTNISHELRTPMQAILGLCDTMLDTALTPGQAELLRTTRQSAEALHLLLDELLDFSRFEAGGLTLDPAPFDLPELLAKLHRALAPRASSRGLAFELRIPAALPQWLTGDAFRLRQVLLNLLGNAIKFTSEGFVRLTVAPLAAPDGAARLRFQVSDSGIGIPPGQQQEIFQPFVQADGSTARKYGGAGLGLAISTRLVDLMGGHLVCASDAAGSTFSFALTFPVAPAPEPGRRLRVLAVEDNAVNRELLVRSLTQLGHEAVAAVHGREALAVLDAGEFDVVLMDIQMPEMDGIAATRAIREREARDRARRPIPIVAITANGTAEDRRRCREAGMSGYLDKPTNRNELARALEGFTAPGFPSLAETATPARPASPATLDREAALGRVGGDEDLLRDIGQLFLEEYPSLLEAIHAAIAAQDAHRLERSAHSLKGSVANFGAAGAVAAALRLEKLGRAQSFDGVAGAVADLESQLSQLRTEIAAL